MIDASLTFSSNFSWVPMLNAFELLNSRSWLEFGFGLELWHSNSFTSEIPTFEFEICTAQMRYLDFGTLKSISALRISRTTAKKAPSAATELWGSAPREHEINFSWTDTQLNILGFLVIGVAGKDVKLLLLRLVLLPAGGCNFEAWHSIITWTWFQCL